MTQRLDLAAVRDLAHVLLPHLFPGDVFFNGNVHARSTATLAKTLPLALALLNGTENPSLLAKIPDRLRINYYSGHTGQHRPSVLALINQSRQSRERFEFSQRPQRDCIVPWPDRLDVTTIPHALADHLHDAARNVGWDPTTEDVERWSALLTAHCRQESGGKVHQDKPGTKAETETLQQLVQSAEALGIDARLLRAAESTAEALARRWYVSMRSTRTLNRQLAG